MGHTWLGEFRLSVNAHNGNPWGSWNQSWLGRETWKALQPSLKDFGCPWFLWLILFRMLLINPGSFMSELKGIFIICLLWPALINGLIKDTQQWNQNRREMGISQLPQGISKTTQFSVFLILVNGSIIPSSTSNHRSVSVSVSLPSQSPVEPTSNIYLEPVHFSPSLPLSGLCQSPLLTWPTGPKLNGWTFSYLTSLTYLHHLSLSNVKTVHKKKILRSWLKMPQQK